ncbi:MAG TPA: metalloregulator ArsR/SmtB family transcription factor [Gaiellales bacterium]|nr:metalloregulator ArsR/SmtB family transcription factor [Gaiellales bacterium]
MTDGVLLHIDEPHGLRLRGARPPAEVAERLANGYRSLGDPTRLSLAMALTGGDELCVCDLAWIAQRSQNLVSHHMKVLKAGGIVSSRKQGKMTMYALTDHGAALLAAAGDA